MGADRRLDEMHICDLLLRCIIGVNEDERSNRQDVVVNVTLYADLSEACRSDRIDRTVDYKALKARLVETVESSAFFLVEALAQTLADCCLSQPRVEKVRVRVDKPGALRFARTVGVEIVRERKVVAYIAVGSNVEPDTHIPAALEALACDARITGLSTFYRTPAIPGAPAMDRPDQADYVNGVVRIETGLSARDLKFGVLRRIEIAAGRVRVEDKFAPRTIDLDVALYGDATIDDPDLEVPDPNIVSRAFIWAPILELDPETVLPGTGKRIADLVSQEARCMWLVKNPQDYDVLVAENLFGDIISDLAAQLVGGLGFACSGNIGDKYAVFEPTHGSAPKYAGQYKVNPTAMLLAAKMMLEWLGETVKAMHLEGAIAEVIKEGLVRTYDMGGKSTTLDLANEVARKI